MMREHLQRDAPSERLLHRLEDDAHPAAPDLAHDAVAPELSQCRMIGRCLACVLERNQRRQQLAQLVRVCGMQRAETIDRDTFARAQSRDELLDETFDRSEIARVRRARPHLPRWRIPLRLSWKIRSALSSTRARARFFIRRCKLATKYRSHP
jgi:hypothetical protein